MRNNLRNHSEVSKRYYQNPTSTIIISNTSVLSSYIPYPIIHLPQFTTLTFHPPQERLTPPNNNSLSPLLPFPFLQIDIVSLQPRHKWPTYWATPSIEQGRGVRKVGSRTRLENAIYS
ncbi:hypothetical protein TNCT_511171 [Trichonephila clavata]|uniref:Uncharacterized protein n=1 Tax=Trichonephila clavata TaxID=2740835 RepID=A0A8X6IPF9_TRICU|nr:hypothetical protein TNCT_511171 [Trichonephila clavata]